MTLFWKKILKIRETHIFLEKSVIIESVTLLLC